jgi:hypothetical protein
MFYGNARPIAVASALTLGLGLAACSERTLESAEADAERNMAVVAEETREAGDAIEKAAGNVGQATENATRTAGRNIEAGAENAGAEVREESNDAARAADRATDGQ